MAVLTRVATDAPPFVPEPVTEEEAAAMFRAAVRLFAHWDITDEQAATLLDMPVSADIAEVPVLLFQVEVVVVGLTVVEADALVASLCAAVLSWPSPA